MMQCPRCGFSQPEDKYCANCGLNIEAYNNRPRNWLLRMLDNPTFYGVFVGILLILVLINILLNPQGLSRGMNSLFRSSMILSKHAGEKKAADDNDSKEKDAASEASDDSDTDVSAMSEAEEEAPIVTYTRLEIGFYELANENVAAINGKVLREGNGWRILQIDDASSVEPLKKAARKLPGGADAEIKNDSLLLDAGDLNPDPQSPYLAVGADWAKNENLHWAIDFKSHTQQLRVPTSQDSTPPLQVVSFDGTVALDQKSALLLIYSPGPQRAPATSAEKLSQSPLQIMASEEYHDGLSSLVIWINFK